MSDAEKVKLLRDALSKTGCTYQYLYKVPEEHFGKPQTRAMHVLWCVRCAALDATEAP